MTDWQLYSQICSLRPDLKKEVSDFVEFLKQKSKAEPKERKFGYAKDFFKMAPDFDELGGLQKLDVVQPLLWTFSRRVDEPRPSPSSGASRYGPTGRPRT
jgi:hypothetical protein